MSYVSFHFAEGPTLELRGMERHYMGHLVEQAAMGAIGLTARESDQDRIVQERFGPLIPEGWWHHGREGRLAQDFAMYLGGSLSEDFLVWKDKPIRSFALMLNTAIVYGSDPVKLAAKLHGTCEIQAIVEGKDRAWFADVIEQGLDTRIFRRTYRAAKSPVAELLSLMKEDVDPQDLEPVEHSMGWTEIIDQLRENDQVPVVTSYSVTNGFPQMPSDWSPEGESLDDDDEEYERREEAWYELSDEVRFWMSLEDVRKRNKNKPISPETLPTLFEHNLTLLDIYHGDVKKIEKALGLE